MPETQPSEQPDSPSENSAELSFFKKIKRAIKKMSLDQLVKGYSHMAYLRDFCNICPPQDLMSAYRHEIEKRKAERAAKNLNIGSVKQFNNGSDNSFLEEL